MVVAAPVPPAPSAAPEAPLPARTDALARGRELAAARRAAPRSSEGEEGFDEEAVRRLLASVAQPCLAERDAGGAACKELTDPSKEPGEVCGALLQKLGEAADPGPRGGSLRLLVQLDVRGVWSAGRAVARMLERRAIAGQGACAPPSGAEIAAARGALADFAIVVGPGAARWPTAGELDDVAYFYASIADAGAEVGSAREDLTSRPLPAAHPDLAARASLRDELHAALLDGDLEGSVRVADAYVRTLGFPGPMRLGEESDQGWHGARASFALRDAARSAEILGRLDLAEVYYRRANPYGGMCGTMGPYLHENQIEGAIRAAEQRLGCRAVVADRLFAPDDEAYGPKRLAQAGFDVARLYAGALHTLGREDAARLERDLLGLPSRADAAVARLGRLGPEAWAKRVRAVQGYADSAQGAGIERLLGLAEQGPGSETRAQALGAVGRLAEDHGWDPCVQMKDGSLRGWGGGSSGRDREVHGVMSTCATRIDASGVDGAVRRITALAAEPDPAVREAAAVALGRLGVPRARGTLAQLARDRFDAGGKVCTSRGSGPLVCEPNRPVARAAREALQALTEADGVRADQRARQARGVSSRR